MPKLQRMMKLTAPDLLALGIVDDVVPEPEGGAHLAPELVFQELDRALSGTSPPAA